MPPYVQPKDTASCEALGALRHETQMLADALSRFRWRVDGPRRSRFRSAFDAILYEMQVALDQLDAAGAGGIEGGGGSDCTIDVARLAPLAQSGETMAALISEGLSAAKACAQAGEEVCAAESKIGLARTFKRLHAAVETAEARLDLAFR